MRILVLSDTHGDFRSMTEALRQQPKAEMLRRKKLRERQKKLMTVRMVRPLLRNRQVRRGRMLHRILIHFRTRDGSGKRKDIPPPLITVCM